MHASSQVKLDRYTCRSLFTKEIDLMNACEAADSNEPQMCIVVALATKLWRYGDAAHLQGTLILSISIIHSVDVVVAVYLGRACIAIRMRAEWG